MNVQQLIHNLDRARTELTNSESRQTFGAETVDSLRVVYQDMIAELDYLTQLEEIDEVSLRFLVANWKNKAAQNSNEIVQTLYAAMIDQLNGILDSGKCA